MVLMASLGLYFHAFSNKILPLKTLWRLSKRKILFRNADISPLPTQTKNKRKHEFKSKYLENSFRFSIHFIENRSKLLFIAEKGRVNN